MSRADKDPDTWYEEVFRDLYERLVSSLAAGWGGPFAAAVCGEDRVLGTGTNTVLRDADVSRHAEVNALAAATGADGNAATSETPRLQSVRGAVLLTTHLPCLMCYAAARWAGIREIVYLFDYEETERLFGFRGDRKLVEDLGLAANALDEDPSMSVRRLRSAHLDRLYRAELVSLWNRSYRAVLLDYDLGDRDAERHDA